MKKIIFVLTILIFAVLSFGCIDTSTESYSARESIVKAQMEIENGAKMQTFISCAEEFVALNESSAEKTVLENKFIECDSKLEAIYPDLNALRDLIVSYKGKMSEQFDQELESYYSDYQDLVLSLFMIRANLETPVANLDTQEKINACKSKETYSACDSCCDTYFADYSGIMTSFMACTNACAGKPNTTISDYCQNTTYPTSCEVWPEETCYTNAKYDAEEKNDLSYCCELADPEEYVDCYANTLISNGRNYSECENIREKVINGANSGYVDNMTTKDLCYYLYASKEAFLEETLDIATTRTICDNINDEELKYLGLCFDIQNS